jgi:hypothetical protein
MVLKLVLNKCYARCGLDFFSPRQISLAGCCKDGNKPISIKIQRNCLLADRLPAAGYWLYSKGPILGKNFLFSTAFRSAVWPTQHPITWVKASFPRE